MKTFACAALSTMLGLPAGTISRQLWEAGLTAKVRGHRGLTAREIAAVMTARQLAERGLTSAEIYRFAFEDRETIHDYACRHDFWFCFDHVGDNRWLGVRPEECADMCLRVVCRPIVAALTVAGFAIVPAGLRLAA